MRNSMERKIFVHVTHQRERSVLAIDVNVYNVWPERFRYACLLPLGRTTRRIGRTTGASTRVDVPNYPPIALGRAAALKDGGPSADHIRRTSCALCDQCVSKECPRDIAALMDYNLLGSIFEPLHLAQVRHQVVVPVIGPPAVYSRTFNHREAVSGIERIESGYVLSLRRSEHRLDNGTHLCRVSNMPGMCQHSR